LEVWYGFVVLEVWYGFVVLEVWYGFVVLNAWYGFVVLEVWYPTPRSIVIKIFLVFNCWNTLTVRE
jgi:hypothetical protein